MGPRYASRWTWILREFSENIGVGELRSNQRVKCDSAHRCRKMCSFEWRRQCSSSMKLRILRSGLRSKTWATWAHLTRLSSPDSNHSLQLWWCSFTVYVFQCSFEAWCVTLRYVAWSDALHYTKASQESNQIRSVLWHQIVGTHSWIRRTKWCGY